MPWVDNPYYRSFLLVLAGDMKRLRGISPRQHEENRFRLADPGRRRGQGPCSARATILRPLRGLEPLSTAVVNLKRQWRPFMKVRFSVATVTALLAVTVGICDPLKSAR